MPALTISRRRLTNGCDFFLTLPRKRREVRVTSLKSMAELLAQDVLFQAVAGIEQHPHRDGLVGKHLDAADVARLAVIGPRRDRSFVALEHLDHHISGIGEQGAAPAARAERADRGQRQQRRVDRKGRAVSRKSITWGEDTSS